MPCGSVVRALAAVVWVLAACESASAPQPLEARLTAADAWSGGDATLVSAAFVPPRALPVVRIGAETLAVRRINDSTIGAQLPAGNGPRTLNVAAPGFVSLTAQVTLHGFRSSEIGPILSGSLELIPGSTRVLGAGTGLVEVDIRTGAVGRTWPETVHSSDCAESVGPSVRPGHYVLWGKDSIGGRCTHPWVWRDSLATLERLDSVYATPGTWGMAEIGPGGSISGGDDALSISHCGSTGCAQQFYFNQGGGLSGVSIAPSANRAVLHHYFGYLVDATTGDTLGRLPFGPPSASPQMWYYHLENATFSANEDTIYAVGNQGFYGSKLVLAASSNGGFIDSLPLPASYAVDVALDPVHPWVYVALLAGTTSTALNPQLLIFERGTLRPIAVLRAPATEALSITAWHQFRLVPDPLMHAAYVVATVQVRQPGPVHAKILRFDLLP